MPDGEARPHNWHQAYQRTVCMLDEVIKDAHHATEGSALSGAYEDATLALQDLVAVLEDHVETGEE